MEKKTIKEICTFLPKSKTRAGEGKDIGKYPFFTSSDIQKLYLNDYHHDGERIIIGTGGKPSCSYFSGKFSVSTDNFVLQTNKILIGKYLYYFLRHNNLAVIEKGFRGAGLKHIGKEYLESVLVPIRDLSEQHSIVATLDKINELIDASKLNLELLDQLIYSKYQEMFSIFTFTKKIGEIISISRGASPRPISYYITQEKSGINWIKIGDVGINDIYVKKTEEKITEEGAQKSRIVKPGDFILSNSMSFGRPYIVDTYGCVHDGWLIISDYQKYFYPLFMYYMLRSPNIQSQFDGSANGSTVRNLNSEIVKNVHVITPPLSKQRLFENLIDKILLEKNLVNNQIANYGDLLNKKMDEYFDGDSNA